MTHHRHRQHAFTLGALALVAAACGGAPPEAAPPPDQPPPFTTHADLGPRPRGIESADLDRGADPCSDFYQFANGSWRAANPIPEGKPRWSRRVATHDANARQLQDLLAEVSAKSDWPAGSAEQLVGDHFASCMDEARVDAAGLKPLAPLLAEIDRSRNVADVQRAMRKLHELAVPALFGVTGDLDFHQPSRSIVNVVGGALGLGEPDAYRASGARPDEARARYRQHVARVLHLAGMAEERAAKAAEGIFALETRLAQVSLDEATAGDAAATAHPTSFAQLKELAPHVDWEAYFTEAALPREDLNVANPPLLRVVDRELAATPLSVWKSYLTFRLLESASPWLGAPFAQESAAQAGVATPRARACAESTDALFGDALGKKYVERYFPPAAKAKVQEIIRNLRAALQEDVARVPWMVPETRARAQAILAAYNPQVGYPDRWKDYSGVTVRRDDLWSNVAAGRRYGVRESRARAGKPTDRNLWQLTPSSPDAYILPELDQMVLPAGFLQPPTFDLEASDAVNYGAIGAGVAHDMTHAIDATGAQVDVSGRHQSWWTDADLRQFQERARCVVDQYDGYFIEPGVHEQGKRVENEAIGDQAGVQLAFRALERTGGTRATPTSDGFTPEQQFFIAYGQFRGDAIRLEAQRKMVASDIHPVSRFRVDGPLSNCPEFQRAFSCQPGAPMARSETARCTVW